MCARAIPSYVCYGGKELQLPSHLYSVEHHRTALAMMLARASSRLLQDVYNDVVGPVLAIAEYSTGPGGVHRESQQNLHSGVRWIALPMCQLHSAGRRFPYRGRPDR